MNWFIMSCITRLGSLSLLFMAMASPNNPWHPPLRGAFLILSAVLWNFADLYISTGRGK